VSGKRNISYFELLFVYHFLERVVRIIVIFMMLAVAAINASTMLGAMGAAV